MDGGGLVFEARATAGQAYADTLVGGSGCNGRPAPAVFHGMKKTDYRAILSAVEQAIAICDSHGVQMDEAHARICEDLRRVRGELRRQLGLPLMDSP